jgi:hypothetical protein
MKLHANAALSLKGREFTHGADLALDSLAPYGEVAEIPPLLEQLRSFPNYGPRSWMTVLRRPLLRLQSGDADVLLGALENLAKPPDTVIAAYLKPG